MKRFRIQLVIALVVLICGVSLMGVIYLVFNKPEVYVNPGVVVTQPSPVATPIQPIRTSTNALRQTGLSHAYPIAPVPYTAAPKAAMQSTRGLYTTSSANVQQVGGGSGYGTATTSGGSAAQRGIVYTTSTVTTFVAFASNSRQVAAPEAQFAPEMASLVTAPRYAPGPPTPGDLDEHQLVEVPVGSPLALVVMAGLYTFVRKRKEDAE